MRLSIFIEPIHMAIAFRIIMAENKNTNIIHLNYELWGDEEEGSRNFSKKYGTCSLCPGKISSVMTGE